MYFCFEESISYLNYNTVNKDNNIDSKNNLRSDRDLYDFCQY
jgi:hypothetical protein